MIPASSDLLPRSNIFRSRFPIHTGSNFCDKNPFPLPLFCLAFCGKTRFVREPLILFGPRNIPWRGKSEIRGGRERHGKFNILIFRRPNPTVSHTIIPCSEKYIGENAVRSNYKTKFVVKYDSFSAPPPSTLSNRYFREEKSKLKNTFRLPTQFWTKKTHFFLDQLEDT